MSKQEPSMDMKPRQRQKVGGGALVLKLEFRKQLGKTTYWEFVTAVRQKERNKYGSRIIYVKTVYTFWNGSTAKKLIEWKLSEGIDLKQAKANYY